MVRRLEQMGELSKETVFIDGTKLEACANKYTFVWKKSVGKWEEKMFLKIQEAVTLLNQEYLQSFRVSEETRIQDIQKICCFIEQVCEEQHTVLYMEEEDAKAGTRGIWSCSAVFWNARLFMTGIQPVSRKGIIIVKQIRTLRLCT